jgi:hypothetical protein
MSMAKKGAPRTPEESVELLARMVREGKLSRAALRLELMRLGLEEQRRWKAIRYVQSGRLDVRRGAEIAGLDEDGFRQLIAR